MKLYNLYEQTILEGVSRSQIIDAIENRYRVRIYYAGDDNAASGKRFVEIYKFGLTKAGNPAISGYQIWGDSKTYTPEWKIFRLDRITKLDPLNKGSIIYYPIDVHSRLAAPYNDNETSDGQLDVIYKTIKFPEKYKFSKLEEK